MNVTPAMQQYYDLKKQYSDCILFFRMGDFYEMFSDDAHIAHRVLWIAITSRNKNSEDPIALAGIPYHAKQKYLPLFIHAGYKVAIAEQVSDPKLKWIVKREVVRVVTPSTLSLESEDYPNSDESQVLLSLSLDNGIYGLSQLNIADNSWKTSQFNEWAKMLEQIYKISPKEVILSKNLFNNSEITETLSKKYSLNMYYFELQNNPQKYLCSHFGVKNLAWFGIEDQLWAQYASAQLLEYIIAHQKWDFSFLNTLAFDSHSDHLEIDESSMRSLDIIYNFSTGSTLKWTLLGVINDTKTPMGNRFMREQIIAPLTDISKIQQRQDFISELVSDTILLSKLRWELKNISDIDAILNRLALWRALPRDLLNLKRSLQSIMQIVKIISESGNKKLQKLLQI